MPRGLKHLTPPTKAAKEALTGVYIGARVEVLGGREGAYRGRVLRVMPGQRKSGDRAEVLPDEGAPTLKPYVFPDEDRKDQPGQWVRPLTAEEV